MRRFAVTLALGLVVVVSTGFGQDPWSRQVRQQLDVALDRMSVDGYALTHDPFIGSLGEGESEDLSLQLEAGVEYYIIGACDADCSDVDLALYDRSGAMIDRDIEEDDVPVLRVKPARSGTYRVEATMAACSSEPCRYGVGVYGD